MRYGLLPLLAFTLAAQEPSFEVASIRPSTSLVGGTPPCRNHKLNPESVLATGYWRLSDLIRGAYEDVVDDFDLPQWTVYTGTFATSVRIPPNTSIEICRQMFRNMLAERFHLVTAVETREVPRYYVKVAKSGLKLKPVDGPPDDPDAAFSLSVKDSVARYVFRGAPMSRIFIAVSAAAVMEARAQSLKIARVVNDPSIRIAEVIDETGLTGYYDGEFQFSPAAILHDELAESLDDALTRQLGLILERRSIPGKVLVLRSSDRMPTEN